MSTTKTRFLKPASNAYHVSKSLNKSLPSIKNLQASNPKLFEDDFRVYTAAAKKAKAEKEAKRLQWQTVINGVPAFCMVKFL